MEEKEEARKTTTETGAKTGQENITTISKPQVKEGISESELEDYRKVFKKELQYLEQELEKTKQRHQTQIIAFQVELEKKRNTHDVAIKRMQDDMENARAQHTADLRELAEEDEAISRYLNRNQGLLDLEKVLLDREEELRQRQRELEDYEKEVNEIEGYLTRRQAICDRKEKDLKLLDENLNQLKKMLASEGKDLDPLSAENKALANWDMLRLAFVSEQSRLKNALKKYKTDLELEQSAGERKDITINQHKQKITDLEQELFRKATKLKQLETQLAIAVGQISRQDSKVSADVPDGTQTVSFRSKSSASGPILEGYPACKGSPARTLSSDAGHFSNGDDSSSHSSENNHHRHMVDGAPVHQKHDASLPFSHSGQVHHGNETKLRNTSRTNRETDFLHSGNTTPSRSHRESQYVHHRRLGRTSSNPLDEGGPERSQRTHRRASHTSSEPLNRTLTSMDDYNMQSSTCSVM